MEIDDVKMYYDNIDSFGDEVMPIEFQEKYTDLAMETYRLALEKCAYLKPHMDNVKKNSKLFFGVDLSIESNEVLYKKGLCRYVYIEGNKLDRLLQKQKMQMVDGAVIGDFWKSYVYDSIGRFLVFCPNLYGIVSLAGNENSVEIKNNHSKVLLAFHFNNFIFHESRSSFVWLENNAPSLLIELCKKYDFDKNVDINNLVIENAIELLNDFSNRNREKLAYDGLFVRRDFDGILHIHEGLICYLCENLEELEFHKNALFICYYSDVLTSIRGDSPFYLQDFSLSERMKIAAYVSYYCHKSGIMTNHNEFRVELVENDDFLSFIRSHNYFDFVGFPDIIESLITEELEWRGLSLLNDGEI